jgi:hypothetical protein
MTLIQKFKGIYVDDSFNSVLPNIDSIIFDCDGVLKNHMMKQLLKLFNMF